MELCGKGMDRIETDVQLIARAILRAQDMINDCRDLIGTYTQMYRRCPLTADDRFTLLTQINRFDQLTEELPLVEKR